MIKVRVMVPVYNTSKYLKKCLDSVINQSLKEIEIICVNDGSTDNSLEILKEFSKKDKRIIIIDKKNGGLTSARNAALEIANGEYCLNIDSDDWIEQGYLEVMYEKAKKEDLDMVVSDIIFDCSYKKERKVGKDLDIRDEEILSGEEYLNTFFRDNFYGYTWNKLIKKKYYDDYNIKYNEEIFVFEDVEVISKLSLNMLKIGKVNKSYYHYIQGENNGSKKVKFKNYLDIEKCFLELEKYFCNNFHQLVLTKKIDILLAQLLYGNYNKDDDYYYKRDELLKEIGEVKKYLDKTVIKAKLIKLCLLFNNRYTFEIIKKIAILKRQMLNRS